MPSYSTTIAIPGNTLLCPVRPVALDALNNHLARLRRDTQAKEMPIRLLCYESHNSKPRISLLRKGDIYPYLARRLEADFRTSHNPLRQEPLWGDRWIKRHAGYAILSHRWTDKPGELTYSDWKKGSVDIENAKCQKLVNFCKAAWENHGLTLGWIDTVCINKESSAELDESIRSMYAWYANSDICITYLAGTESLVDMHNDLWFRRGWTFQELLAPNCVKFYNKHWMRLSPNDSNDLSQRAKELGPQRRLSLFGSDKEDPSILKVIHRATTITPDELQDIRATPISRRMQLAAKREVTRKEDIAYSLMGIFDVSMSTAYGEGPERAFYRLVKEIFDSTKDVSDIFNWGGRRTFSSDAPWTPITSLFPTGPSDFESRSSRMYPWHPIEPLTLTHVGLRTPILLMPVLALLRSAQSMDLHAIGDYYATVAIPGRAVDVRRPRKDRQPIVEFPDIDTCYVLAKRVFHPELKEVIFGTLNVEAFGTDSLRIPKTCFALLLDQDAGGVSTYTKIHTERPIVFDLMTHRNNYDGAEDNNYYKIKGDQLEKHGMKLATLYL
jgi:hypothetical protein